MSQDFSDVSKQPSLEWSCVNLKGEIMAESCQWVSSIKVSILSKKGWFSHVRVSLNEKNYGSGDFTIPLTFKSGTTSTFFNESILSFFK